MTGLSGGLVGCFRCGYVWRPERHPRPRICPRCKSRLWDVPRLRSVRQGKGLGLADIVLPQRQAILAAARKHGFSHVRVFGSVRRSEASARSDVDLLVDREGDPSLLDRAALTSELEAMLGRPVDVVPEDCLHWLVRPQVLFEAVVL